MIENLKRWLAKSICPEMARNEFGPYPDKPGECRVSVRNVNG